MKKAKKIVRKQLNSHDRAVVACSFGKDSLTVLHLVKTVCDKLEKDFDVLWNNTKVHYPSVYKIKDKLEREWDLNIIETEAKMKFKEVIKKYGWPGFNAGQRYKDKASNGCCYQIKKKPTKQAIKNNDWDLYFDGLTAYESDTRFLSMKQYGMAHYHKDFGLQKVHPIGWWSVDDVWDYIEKHDIPYPDVYDKEVENYTKRGYSEQVCGHRVDRAIRNGCWCCTLAIKNCPEKMKQLRKYYPKMWDALMRKWGLADKIAEKKLGGQGSLTEGYYTEETRDHWLEERPCFFDQI